MNTRASVSSTPPRESGISASGIYKSYGTGKRKANVLRGIAIRAKSGEFTAITGPSGSGKTTLLRILGGLSRPDGGNVILNGTNLYNTSDRQRSMLRNRQIGFVFQDYRLLPNYNALENVMLPLKLAGLPKKDQKDRAKQVLTEVGLGQYIKARVSNLSGGQQQRVSIARALAMRPSILIADEPTGNLDQARGAEIIELFQSLKTNRNIALLMVTHDEHLAAQADHVVRMVDGKVTEDTYAHN